MGTISIILPTQFDFVYYARKEIDEYEGMKKIYRQVLERERFYNRQILRLLGMIRWDRVYLWTPACDCKSTEDLERASKKRSERAYRIAETRRGVRAG